MCGITGYVGTEKAFPIIFNSLKKLEYRGYDSWGVVVKDNNNLQIHKQTGKISRFNLDDSKLKQFESCSGIGHSRWATHGKVCEINAHPHTDCDGKVAVVHNGIIENFHELKQELTEHNFVSETDSEIIPHMIENELGNGSSFEDAMKQTVRKLKGRYAIVAISNDSEKMIAVRNGSPLIIGVKDCEEKKSYFISSDIPAFLEHTRNVMYLDDNEMVVIGEDAKFYNIDSDEEVFKRLITIDWEASQAQKGDYPHFMIKEIMEQKETIRRAINQDEEKILEIADDINNAYGTFLTACGTAGKVCLAGEYIFSKNAGKHINYVVSSEFPNYKHFLTDKTLLLTVSQSGETADVLEAIKAAKEKNVKITSLVNVMGSSIYRQSDNNFLVNAGPEKAVASTKATTSQLALITLLAHATAGKLDEGKRLLVDTAAKVNDMLNPRYEERIKNLAQKICSHDHIYIIGRGVNYSMALESAIKIMEVSYIHAHGFAGGELKHGPIALIGEGTPCIALVANDEVKNEIINNATEVKARGGYIIGVAPENNDVFDYWIKVPDVGIASPIVNIIPIQMLAYYLAINCGCDPDYPKNLAKSVTVK
jgi:glucosamine--fructose-6-phosphate aminotransferase (isomerizing)